VDIATETFAMAASVTRARALLDTGAPEGRRAVATADVFCRSARRRIRSLLRELWSNDDVVRYRHGTGVLAGVDEWLEAGILSDAGRPATPGSPADAEVPAVV
jgi:hypothetical protein